MTKADATILIVDDDENDRFFIERAFRKIGVTAPIHFMNGGNEAIAYMKGEGKYADREQFRYPTFIMTDLRMEDGSGFDVLYHIKTNPKWAIIPSIVLSSSTDPDDIQMSYLLGASSYHIKASYPAQMEEQLSILYSYWMTCQVPEVDGDGKQTETTSRNKLGERFRELLRNTLKNNDAEEMK